jgi:hypothetical protein
MHDDKRLLEQRPDGEFAKRAKKKGQSFAVLRQLVNLRKHIMHKIIPLSGLAIFVLILIAMPSDAVAAEKFECPFPVGPNTSAKLQEIKRLLPDGNAMADPERLNATVGTLRRDGMPKSLIIGHLVGAYCPMVAQESSLTEAEKSAGLQRFTGQITRLVYSLESGLDIIINVPLTPDVVAVLNATASKQGLSGAAWIAMTVENTLQR